MVDAVIANRRRDHRHLQRRHLRGAPGRTRGGRGRPACPDASDRTAVRGRTARSRRVRSPASRAAAASRSRTASRSRARRPGAERLADVAEDRVDRVLEAGRQVDVAERLGRLGVTGVPHPLAVLLAVAGVVERRVGREPAGVERGCGRDHLERRARRVLAGGRAVQKRQRRTERVVRVACAEALLDQVRVVRRVRRHHEHAARRRLERDDRAALAAAAARSASACAPGRIVSTRSFPVTVVPRSLSSAERKTVSRFAFDPVRKSLYDCSRPVRLRDCVE